MKKMGLLFLPIIIILVIVAGAIGWKMTNDLKSTEKTGAMLQYNDTSGNPSSGFDTTGASQEAAAPSAVTADIEQDLDVMLQQDSTSDLDAVDKQVGTL